MAPPPKNQAEIDAANRYESYRRGWKQGAAQKAADKVFLTHTNKGIAEAYSQGYADGFGACSDALKSAAAEYGIDLKLAVLR